MDEPRPRQNYYRAPWESKELSMAMINHIYDGVMKNKKIPPQQKEGEFVAALYDYIGVNIKETGFSGMSFKDFVISKHTADYIIKLCQDACQKHTMLPGANWVNIGFTGDPGIPEHWIIYINKSNWIPKNTEKKEKHYGKISITFKLWRK